MTLTLRAYIAISTLLHVAVFVTYEFAVQRTAVEVKPPPKAITIRSKPREIKQVVEQPKPVTSTKPKPTASKPTSKPKPAPKIIPVFKPDAPPAPAVVNEPEVEEVDDSPDVSDAAPSAAVQSSGPATGPADLTREASVVASSIVKPVFTKEATAARLQGAFAVDIHLDENGKALEIELVQPVGYGMDERIIAALQNAKYLSKQDAAGKGQETWLSIQFKLERE